MIRNIFGIDNEEKRRILSLHENAVKKTFLLREQNEQVLLSKNFGNFFESGDYNMNKEYEQNVINTVKEISDYIKNNKLKSFEIVITPGESLVPNQPPFDKERGSLARERGNVLKTYLESVLSKMGIQAVFKINEPVIGKENFDPKTDSKDDEKYKKEQFVKADIVLTREPEEKPRKIVDLIDKIMLLDKGVGFVFKVKELLLDKKTGYNKEVVPTYNAIVVFPSDTDYYKNAVGNNQSGLEQEIEKAKAEHKTNVVQRGTTEQNNYEPWAVERLKNQELFTKTK